VRVLRIFLLAFFAWPILFISGCLMEPFYSAFNKGWNLSKNWREQRESKLPPQPKKDDAS
jgi:hypothetical protein